VIINYYFDIGNSRGKFWRCSNGRAASKIMIEHEGDIERLISGLPRDFDDVPEKLCGLAVLNEQQVARFSELSEEKWRKTPLFAKSEAWGMGIKNGYHQPETLGVDRWVGLIAIGAAFDSFCVVDCGTALTLDVVKYGSHQGGYILPGLRVMSDVLRTRTAGVLFAPPRDINLRLGHNTAEAVVHGALLAAVSVIEKVVRENDIYKVILTGGDAARISLHLQIKHIVEPELILKGLIKYFK